MKRNCFFLGMLVMALIFSLAFISCDANGGNGNGEKTLAGTWTKTTGGIAAIMTVNTDGTWAITTDGEPFTNGTWDTTELSYVYDFDPENPENLTVPYQLSANGNSFTLSGENAVPLGGTGAWTRVN